MQIIKDHELFRVAVNVRNHFVISLPMPYRHHHLLHWLSRHSPAKIHKVEIGQGFWIDNLYLNREEAFTELYIRNYELIGPVYGEKLYSENLWTDIYGDLGSEQRAYYDLHEDLGVLDQKLQIHLFNSNDTNP